MISQRTYTGRRIDLEAPTPDMICLEDIAQGLSQCCRFAGQIEDFYSVAQHAVLVSMLVDVPLKWAALNHDDTEAYMGDMSHHLKHHHLLIGYRQLESNLAHVIAEALNCQTTPNGKAAIKNADNLAALFEHWTMRAKRPWNAKLAIDWAIRDGFVMCMSGSPLMRLASKLPATYVPMPAQMAKRWFNEHVVKFRP